MCDSWVYFITQNHEKVKFQKNYLKSKDILNKFISEIENNVRSDTDLIIYMPDWQSRDLVYLVNFLLGEEPENLKKANFNVKKFICEIKKLPQTEETLINLEVPDENWFQLADEFIKQEFPELLNQEYSKSEDAAVHEELLISSNGPENEESIAYENEPVFEDHPMQLYTEPQICANQPSIQEKNLKQRALDFLKRRIECETLNRPKFVTSLASSILIGAKHHFDRDIVTPSQTIFICQLKWNGAKFNGSGMKKCDALENASIAAVNALFGLNLKSLIPPCCSKLNDSFIKKIKIEEIYKNSVAEKVFVMSVNLPGSGKKISAESFSQNNATEILYNMAMEAYIKDELLKIERYNVKILVKFFQNNASHIESNTENVERIFERKMRKEYLEKGLEWIKKNLDKDSFVKITPEDLLEHFLPNSEITITECSCTVKFSDHKWSATLSSGLEAKEVVVNEIMKELFDIDLVPYHCENLPELQKQLKEQVEIKGTNGLFHTKLTLDGKTIKVTARNPLTAEKLTVAQALNVIQEKYKEEVLTLNRKSFSKFFVNENSPLVDRVEFVLNHFSFQNIHGKSRFEPVIWLLNVFERTLLDKIDKSIHIEVYFNNQYKAVTIMNNKEISCLNTSKVQARRDLIVKAIKESEEIKDPITIICKASLYQHAKNELKAITSSTDPKPDITSPKIEFYKNKVLVNAK